MPCDTWPPFSVCPRSSRRQMSSRKRTSVAIEHNAPHSHQVSRVWAREATHVQGVASSRPSMNPFSVAATNMSSRTVTASPSSSADAVKSNYAIVTNVRADKCTFLDCGNEKRDSDYPACGRDYPSGKDDCLTAALKKTGGREIKVRPTQKNK